MGRISNFFNNRYQNAKRAVNRGLGTNILKDSSLMIWETATSFFHKKTPTPETFAQATERLQLSDADLKARVKSLKMEILIYSLSALAAFSYAIYLGVAGNQFMSVVITMLVAIALGSCAFRSHFWLFQLKHKKLGCTIKEWLNSSVKELN